MMSPNLRRAASPGYALLLLAACATGDEPAGRAASADTVYIGVAAARTAAAEGYFQGVELALEHLNAARPRGRPPLGLRLPPAEQPSQVAVAAFFRDDPRVVGVVGHTGSGQTMEATPIYGDVDHGGRNGVVAVSPTATNPLVTRASDWVFRVCPTDVDGAQELARFAADSLGARRVAVIYRNDLFGRGFTRAFAAVYAASGHALLEKDPYLGGITEFEAYAERIARRGADALVIAGGATDAAEIVRSLRAAGGTATVLGTDDLAALRGDPAAAREFPGVRFTAFFLPERATTPAARDYVAAFQERFGTLPDHRSALSYDAATLIGQAVFAEGADRRRVRDHLARVGNGLPPHAGVTGEIRFDANGDPVRKSILIGEVQP